MRLALSLLCLESEQSWDIQSNFIISVEDFYCSLYKVVDAVILLFPVDLDFTDALNVVRLEQRFSAKSRHNRTAGTVRALDGYDM